MSDTAILERLDNLTAAFITLARMTGARLSRVQMCERLGVSSNTLTARVRKGDVPTPGKDGKWLLSEVVDWESRDASRNV
jgi:predicted DNA-binding transcriptional regulator AlpA